MSTTQITIQKTLLDLILDSSLDNLKQIENFIPKIIKLVKNGQLSKSEITELVNLLPENYKNTIHSHAIQRPYGYAGDFLIIDKIYTNHISDDVKAKNWDIYFHNQAAPQAVRNRKEYFKQIVFKQITSKKEFSLLNIASGPARDLKEVYDKLDNIEMLKSTCVDMDKHAIEYAVELNKNYLSQINFINKNIFKFSTKIQYDLVWSAGLFDYFDERAFIFCLKKFKTFCKPEGEIIIGNFNASHNPSRDYMEIFGDWKLNHRTTNQLRELALNAGFRKDQIAIGHERENVNLFLHLKND